MAFEPHPIISSIIQALRGEAFLRTAGTLESFIREGFNDNRSQYPREYSLDAQKLIAAAVIEHNIVMPYRAWEETVTLIARANGTEIEAVDPDELLVLAGDAGLAPLGSVAYRGAIERLAEIVDFLRGGPPPSPRTGGGPPGGPGHGGGPGGPAAINRPLQIAANSQRPLPYADQWTGGSWHETPSTLETEIEREENNEITIKIGI